MPYNYGTYGMYEPQVNAAVVAAVKTAFARSRSAPRNWQGNRVTGRLDDRQVWRSSAYGSRDIFRERIRPGANKVNVHILVDGSGSMTGRNKIQNAADIAATLVDAFASQPAVRINVWLHNTVVTGAYGKGGDLSIFPVVTNGKGRANLGKMPRNAGGGNGDGYAIDWVGQRVRRGHRKGETDLLIVVSDGLPSFTLADRWMSNGGRSDVLQDHVKSSVIRLEQEGVKVLSVAIDPNEYQPYMYGEDNVVPFTGDWNKLAVDFGAALGQTLAHPLPGLRRR